MNVKEILKKYCEDNDYDGFENVIDNYRGVCRCEVRGTCGICVVPSATCTPYKEGDLERVDIFKKEKK